jgi:hypothetical protein
MLSNIAKFYAEHGITVDMADDVFSFVLEWMKASRSIRPSQADEINGILSHALSKLEEHEDGPPRSMGSPPDIWSSHELL